MGVDGHTKRIQTGFLLPLVLQCRNNLLTIFDLKGDHADFEGLLYFAWRCPYKLFSARRFAQVKVTSKNRSWSLLKKCNHGRFETRSSEVPVKSHKLNSQVRSCLTLHAKSMHPELFFILLRTAFNFMFSLAQSILHFKLFSDLFRAVSKIFVESFERFGTVLKYIHGPTGSNMVWASSDHSGCI